MKRLKKIGIVVGGVYLVLWSLTWLVSPSVTRWVVGDLLAPHQLELDSDSSVRLNLLTSCVTIEDLVWHKSKHKAFQLDALEACYSLHRLLFNEATLKRLTLTGLTTEVRVKEGGLAIAGFELPASSEEELPVEPDKAQPAEESKPLSIALAAPEVVLEGIKVTLEHMGQPHALMIEQLKINRSRYESEALHTEVELLLTLNGAELEVTAALDNDPGNSFATLKLELSGFDPAPYQYLLPDILGELSAQLGLALDLKLKRDGEQLELVSDASSVIVEALTYSDQVVVAKLESFKFEIEALISQLSLDASHPVNVDAEFLANLEQLKIDETSGQGELATLKTLKLNPSKFTLKGEQVSLSLPELELKELRASTRTLGEAQKLPPLLALESLRVKEIQASEKALSIEQILIGEILAQVQRNEQGELVSLVTPTTATQASQGEPAEPEQANEESSERAEAEPFGIQLSQLSLDKPAVIHFSDLSLTPELAKTLTIEQLELSKVNSLEPSQMAEVAIQLKDEEYFRYQLTGEVAPFGEKLNLNFDAKATEFPLYQISPYVRDALGFDVLAGQLDLDAKGGVTEDELDTEVVVFLRGATFDSGSGDSNKDESSVIGQAAVPLDMALGMLKDDDGNIELTIPVDGDVQDPSFGVHYIFGLIAKKAVMSQAQDYLLTTLTPYAQVIKVGMMAGSYALKVRFDDLEYAPGQIAPAEQQALFVEQFQTLMADKESLQVKVCGVATASELGLPNDSKPTAQQQEQLLELAKQRAGAFKKALVEKGTPSSRMLLCVPTFETSSDAKPRLKLSV